MKINFASLGNKETTGILYILQIRLEDKDLVKVGVTSRKIEERVCEIVTAVWVKYRYFPQVYTKKFKTVSGYKEKERQMLDRFKGYRYTTQHKFCGYTELFDVDVIDVVAYYDKLNKDTL